MKSVSVGSSRPAVSNPLRTRVSSDMASVPSEEHSPTSSYNAYPGDAEHPPAYPGRDVEAGVGPSGPAAPHGGAGGEEQRSTNGEVRPSVLLVVGTWRIFTVHHFMNLSVVWWPGNRVSNLDTAPHQLEIGLCVHVYIHILHPTQTPDTIVIPHFPCYSLTLSVSLPPSLPPLSPSSTAVSPWVALPPLSPVSTKTSKLPLSPPPSKTDSRMQQPPPSTICATSIVAHFAYFKDTAIVVW